MSADGPNFQGPQAGPVELVEMPVARAVQLPDSAPPPHHPETAASAQSSGVRPERRSVVVGCFDSVYCFWWPRLWSLGSAPGRSWAVVLELSSAEFEAAFVFEDVAAVVVALVAAVVAAVVVAPVPWHWVH